MKEDKFYFIDILESIKRIRAYAGSDEKGFMESTQIQDAVIRNFEIIGEASKKISDGLKLSHPEVPWKRIAGFRDVLIHNYGSVDLTEVWNVLEYELINLENKINTIFLELNK